MSLNDDGSGKKSRSVGLRKFFAVLQRNAARGQQARRDLRQTGLAAMTFGERDVGLARAPSAARQRTLDAEERARSSASSRRRAALMRSALTRFGTCSVELGHRAGGGVHDQRFGGDVAVHGADAVEQRAVGDAGRHEDGVVETRSFST